MKVKTVLRVRNMMIVALSISLIVTIIISFSVGRMIIDKNISVYEQQHKAELIEYKEIVEDYREEYESVIYIRDKYREYVKEIVEMLYNKDSYLGIGGAGEPLTGSDEVVLLQLRNTILGMEDDLRMMSGVKEYLTSRQEFANSFPFTWPIDRNGVPEITSSFGIRPNIDIGKSEDGIHFHAGIDIKGEKGELIVATADGRVYWSDNNHYLYGKLIIINHKYDMNTYYAHLDEIFVKRNQLVKRGEVIGTMGDTGEAQGVHIHYEIRNGKVALDPMTFLSTNF